MNTSESPAVFNQSDFKQRRQSLRRNMTEPEKRLWQRLRNHQLGVKFRRQHGIGAYIVDFYCAELKWAVELDGESHFTDDAREYDRLREVFMASLGVMTIRFSNKDVMNNLDGIVEHVNICIQNHRRANPL